MSLKVRVVYHCEDGCWWADSDDAPGYYAGAGTLEQLREAVREGLEFHLQQPVEVSEESVEIVDTTRRSDGITVEQTLCHRAAGVMSLGSTQLTTLVSGKVKLQPVPPVVSLRQPRTEQGWAMAGY